MVVPQTVIVPSSWVAAQDPTDWLTSDEQTLCDLPSSPQRRTDRLAGRLALKHLLRETFGIAPLSYEVGSDGPAPALSGWPGPPGLVVSLSHSAGLGAASWAWGHEEETVGVDVQVIRPVHLGLRARALTEEENQQGNDILLFWALKEAAIKARRQPWGRALKKMVVTLETPLGEHGSARIAVAGEPSFTACYAHLGGWWLARASRPRRSE